MKRKIIKLGQATYVASLPSKWIREHQLEKGDYLEMEEKEGDLLLSTEKKHIKSLLSINITSDTDKQIRGKLENAYRLGFYSIEVIHGPKIKAYSYFIKKQGSMVDASPMLQSFVDQKFINMAIVEQSEKRTLIKDLGMGVNEESVQNIFQRILYLISQEGGNILGALQHKDRPKLESMAPSFRNTQKFILYYQRLLNLSALSKNSLILQNSIVQELNHINSAYKAITDRSLALPKINYSANALHMLELINSHFEEMKQLCLQFDERKAQQFFVGRSRFWDEGYKGGATSDDFALVLSFGSLISSIWYIMRELYGLQIICSKTSESG